MNQKEKEKEKTNGYVEFYILYKPVYSYQIFQCFFKDISMSSVLSYNNSRSIIMI